MLPSGMGRQAHSLLPTGAVSSALCHASMLILQVCFAHMCIARDTLLCWVLYVGGLVLWGVTFSLFLPFNHQTHPFPLSLPHSLGALLLGQMEAAVTHFVSFLILKGMSIPFLYERTSS